jgi:mannose-6-phosphate isomerase-like protein (cupin superfamily)
MTQHVFHEPEEYEFKDRDGHDGKFFSTNSKYSGHLIVECHDKLRVSLIQHEVEFNYYIINGQGEFVFNDTDVQPVKMGDLIVVAPGTKYTFRGELKMLLINTPSYSPEQEEIFPLNKENDEV